MSASELLLLKKSFERLDKQYRGAEEKIVEFRDKLREARLELATKDRQLDAARKLLSKLGNEKSELAMVAEQNRELSRSLEAKLSLSHDVPELHAKLHRSNRKVASLTAQLHEAQTRLLMCEEAGRQQAAEVAVLKRALGLRSELPEGLAGGYEGQAQLLQALAKSQDESASLAAQLADGSRKITSLEQQVDQLHGDVDRLVGGRVAAEEALQVARRDMGEAHGRVSALQGDVEELKSQLRRTAAHLQEVQSARQSAEEAVDSLTVKNRALKEKLAAAEREARTQMDSLRGELRSLAHAAAEEVQQLHALHSSREGEWEVQQAALQKQLTEMEARLSQSDRDHEVEVLRLQSRTGALEASLEGSRLREASLEREAEALRDEVARLGRSNSELAAALAAARNEAEAVSERAEEAFSQTDSERRLRMQVQSQLEAVSTRAAVREEQLSSEVQSLRTELASVGLMNERLKGDLKASQEKLSDASARHTINERHIDELHITIQSLTKSKTKLQNTMLEQLSLFKAKLHQVEQENLALRTALSSVSASSSSRCGAADPRVGRPITAAHGDGALARGGGGGRGGGAAYQLTANNLHSLTASARAAAAEMGGTGGGGVSLGGTSTTSTSVLTPIMSLRDTGLGATSGGGCGGGGGGGGSSAAVRGSGSGSGGGGDDDGSSSRLKSGLLGLGDSHSEGILEATLGRYDA